MNSSLSVLCELLKPQLTVVGQILQDALVHDAETPLNAVEYAALLRAIRCSCKAAAALFVHNSDGFQALRQAVCAYGVRVARERRENYDEWLRRRALAQWLSDIATPQPPVTRDEVLRARAAHHIDALSNILCVGIDLTGTRVVSVQNLDIACRMTVACINDGTLFNAMWLNGVFVCQTSNGGLVVVVKARDVRRAVYNMYNSKLSTLSTEITSPVVAMCRCPFHRKTFFTLHENGVLHVHCIEDAGKIRVHSKQLFRTYKKGSIVQMHANDRLDVFLMLLDTGCVHVTRSMRDTSMQFSAPDGTGSIVDIAQLSVRVEQVHVLCLTTTGQIFITAVSCRNTQSPEILHTPLTRVSLAGVCVALETCYHSLQMSSVGLVTRDGRFFDCTAQHADETTTGISIVMRSVKRGIVKMACVDGAWHWDGPRNATRFATSDISPMSFTDALAVLHSECVRTGFNRTSGYRTFYHGSSLLEINYKSLYVSVLQAKLSPRYIFHGDRVNVVRGNDHPPLFHFTASERFMELRKVPDNAHASLHHRVCADDAHVAVIQDVPYEKYLCVKRDGTAFHDQRQLHRGDAACEKRAKTSVGLLRDKHACARAIDRTADVPYVRVERHGNNVYALTLEDARPCIDVYDTTTMALASVIESTGSRYILDFSIENGMLRTLCIDGSLEMRDAGGRVYVCADAQWHDRVPADNNDEALAEQRRKKAKTK